VVADVRISCSEGTQPAGSMWSMLPIPENGLGPRCLPGPDDVMTGPHATPHGCQKWEGRDDGHNGHVPGPCVPCPETPGSDCSRCDNGGKNAKSPSFPPPLSGVEGAPIEGVFDMLKVPADLPAGEYVLGYVLEFIYYIENAPHMLVYRANFSSSWAGGDRYRYDCEATAQVWSNCADITLAK
jgi:hypothetical protein